MSLSTYILLLVIAGSAIAELVIDPYTLPITSIEDQIRLASWTEDDKQNIWELSGQFEGDIVLSPAERNGVISQSKRWSNKVIPYEIDPSYNNIRLCYIAAAQVNQIDDALTEYATKTCITARRRRAGDVDYVYVSPARPGCFSRVGRQTGRQVVNLAPNRPGNGCFRSGTIVHEFMHALGFHHQQSDSDRDNYVAIQWQNIKNGTQGNFRKYPNTVVTSFGYPYDYGSVMHYSAYSFSKNNQKTIVTTAVPNAPIGQRVGLSQTDVDKIQAMYGC